MTCRDCGALIPKEALFCTNCGKIQALLKVLSRPVDTSIKSPDTPPHPFSTSNLFQSVQQFFQEEREKNLEQLTILQDEMSIQAERVRTLEANFNRFEQLQSEDAEEGPKLVPLKLWAKIVITLLMISLGSGILWILYQFFIGYFTHGSDDLQITGAVLTILGAIYLAYDLFGRRYKPLKWLSLYISYWIMGVLILEPVALLIVAIPGGASPKFNYQMVILLTILAGSISAGISMIVGIPNLSSGKYRFSWKSAVAEGLFWWLLWIIFILSVHIVSGPDYIHLLSDLLATPVMVVGAAILGFIRPRLAGPVETSNLQAHFLSKKGCLKGMLSGFGIMIALPAYLVVDGLLSPAGMAIDSSAIMGVLTVVVSSMIIGGIVGSIARYMYWRVRNLEKFALGGFGLFLIFLGAVAQVLSAVLQIHGK